MTDLEAQTVEQKKGFCGQLGSACYSCFFSSSENSAAGYVRLFNMVNAILLFLTGLLALLNITNILSLSLYFMSFYVMIFGLLLCCFEMRFSWVEKRVRDSFGFLYTFLGRTIFLLFLSSFCFGISTTGMGLGVGIVTAINALFNMVIMYRHGKMFEDPSADYGTAEQQGAQFLRNNPNLAQNAIGAGVNLARDNPDIARAGLQAGAQYARDHPQDASAIASGAYRSTVY